MKDQLISLFDEYVKNTSVEDRKELYLKGWDGYYTKSLKSVSELPEEVLEMIETLHSEGEFNDIEVFQEIQDDFAVEYLKEEYGVDMEDADDEQIEEAEENNFFTETGLYAFTNYIVSIVEEKYLDLVKEQTEVKAMEITNELRKTFISNGIIINSGVDSFRSTSFDAEIYQINSVDEAWTISVYAYDCGSIDWTIDFNGTEDVSSDLEETQDIINNLPVEHSNFWK
jgi:uncharacterized protein (DUF2344 family)